MSSDLRWKFILIAIIILLCIFGVVGLPEFPTSAKQLKQNLADRIKLGLDLKGGSHLVLQVQVDEAIGQRCDETIDALTKQLHEKNVNVGETRRVDDTHIMVRNIDPATSSTFRDIVANQFPDWSMSPAPGEQNGYLLTLKPSIVATWTSRSGRAADCASIWRWSIFMKALVPAGRMKSSRRVSPMGTRAGNGPPKPSAM